MSDAGRTPVQPEPPRGGHSGQAPPPAPGRLGWRPWLWWVLLAITLLWNGYALLGQKGPPAVELPYSAFLAQAQAGNVDTVTLTGQALEGTTKQPVSWPPAATANAPTPPISGPGGVTSTRFTSVMPALGDPSLLPLLQQQGVTVSVKDTSGGSVIGSLLVNLLPMLFLVGVLVVMGRQAQRNQQAIFGFGGSTARRYNREQPGVTRADVAGEEEAKAELGKVVDFLQHPDRYRALGARLPHGVLLIGPPGTGKTLLGRAVAGEAGVPFFSISASEFVEMFVGVGASRVRDLFAKAKSEPAAIVFVDEIDAVGRQRGAGTGGGNDEREQTLNQLLVEMDGFDEHSNVIVLAATNRPDVLDPALLRPGRFDRQVTVGLPDRAGREAILRLHSRRLPLDPEVELALLARRTPGFSGADLANLTNEAALMAARRHATRVNRADFDEALDKIVLGTRQAVLLSEAERRLVAYHEGGHALMAELTPGADPVAKLTIIPHGRALGVTAQLPEEDRHNYPKDYLLGRLAVMMGGRAAEDLVFGQPTTGAENDLKSATSLARRMVGLWGMDDTVGRIAYGIGETQPFLGRELAEPRDFSDATAAEIDRAVRRLIESSYGQAREVLQQHRPVLDALVEELLHHETIDRDRLTALLARFAPTPGHPAATPAATPADPTTLVAATTASEPATPAARPTGDPA